MNTFERELSKVFTDCKSIDNPTFVGSACYGNVAPDLKAKIQFVTMGRADYFEAMRIEVINRTEGKVDSITMRLSDLLGKKRTAYYPEGMYPYIWKDRNAVEWYAYHPTAADYAALRDAVGQYLSAFRERTPELERSGPKLVYICAPLRGDVTNNVEFARQKAQEVFVEGNIPICPHLLFPPVADPADPAQDEKARAMGLRLLESCQQMNVYGPVWTDGMWQEIYKAGELGIPVLTDQKTIGRTPPARHPKRKER